MQEKIKTGLAVLTAAGLLIGAYVDMRSQIDVLTERVDSVSTTNEKFTTSVEKLSDAVGMLSISVARLEERTRSLD